MEDPIKKQVLIPSNLKKDKLCFLDIETTGLNKSMDTIYLVGLICFDESIDMWKSIQIFAEELNEEVEILLEAYKIISNFDVIVNYNGSSFDIPFINNKLKYYKTDLSIDINLSLDIYRIVQSNRNILPLDNLKLKTIEEYLGIYREDKHTGKDCINFYFDFLLTKNRLSRENILLHNYDDLYYLLDVLNILDILDSKKSFLVNYKNNDNLFCIENFYLNKDYLYINGHIKDSNLASIVYFADNYKVIINRDNSFEVSIEVIKGLVTPTKSCLFIRSIDFNLSNKTFCNDEYKIPRDLILLEVEKIYQIENIKMVMGDLIERILED